jgi:DNA-binding transcriptional LysR family regulator
MNRNMPMDLIRSFVAIADAGTVTRAAAQLGRSQPAVTLQMQRLEDVLDQRLLVWDGRRTRPTPAGERLLSYAREILRLNDEAVGNLAESAVAGHVKIGTPNDFATSFLPRVLGRFAGLHADVSLEVVCDLSRKLVELLLGQSDELDIVLAMHADRPGISARRLWKEELVWVGGPGHALGARRPLPLVVYPEGCIYRSRMEEALSARKIAWRIAYASPSLSGIRAAVEAGLGITVLAKSTVPPGLTVLRDAALPSLRGVFIALHRRKGRLSPAAARLADFIVESLNDSRTALN